MKNRQLFLRCLIAQIGLMVLFSMPAFGQDFEVNPSNQMVNGDPANCNVTLDITPPPAGSATGGGAQFPMITMLGTNTVANVTILSNSVSGGTINGGTAEMPIILLDPNIPFATLTVNIQIENNLGGLESHSFIIQVNDTSVPTLSTMPGDITVFCVEDVPDLNAPVVNLSDACASGVTAGFTPSVSPTDYSTTFGCTGGMITRTWADTDAAGNSVSHTQTITVEADIVGPVITGDLLDPGPLCAISSYPAVTDVAGLTSLGLTISDNCMNTAALAVSSTTTDTGAGTCPTIYERVYTVTDACNNTSTSTQTITVDDATAPTFDTTPQNGAAVCSGAATDAATQFETWVSNGGNAVINDNCAAAIVITAFVGGVEITNDPSTALTTPCPNGVYTVDFIFTDGCGETLMGSADFTINDTSPPNIDIGAQNQTVDCNAMDNNTATITAWLTSLAGTATSDDCTGLADTSIVFGALTFDYATEMADAIAALAVEIENQSSTCTITNELARVNVSFQFEDACGLMSSSNAALIVEDKDAPDWASNMPDDLTLECDGLGNAADITAWLAANENGPVFMGVTGAALDCATTVNYTNNYASLSNDCAATGTSTVVFTATDVCGNVSTASATITVEDKTAPSYTVPLDTIINCGELLTVANVGDVIDEDDVCDVDVADGGLREASFTDTSVPGACTGTMTITRRWILTDDCGNSNVQNQTITVQDTLGPVWTEMPDDLIVECDGMGNTADINDWLAANQGGAQPINTQLIEGLAIDACSTVTYTNDIATAFTGACGMTGVALVTFTATDECGNTSTAQATVTIEDTVDPILTNAAMDMTVECDGNGNTTELNAWLANNAGATATDLCSDDVITWTNNYTSLSNGCAMTGTGSIIFTATDACGRTTPTMANFTIQDTTAPDVSGCANLDTEVQCTDVFVSGTTGLTWNTNNVTALETCSTDVCGDITVTSDYPGTYVGGACPSTGVLTVEYTVTDDCGQSTIVTADYTIIDDVSPTIMPTTVAGTEECGGGDDQAALETWMNAIAGAIAMDNCSGTNITWSAIWVDTDGNMNPSHPAADPISAGNYPIIAATDCDWFVDVTFVAEDQCMNQSTSVSKFSITDTTLPVFAGIPANTTVECSAIPVVATPTATDNCNLNMTIVSAEATTAGACTDAYTITRTWSVTDDCGNSAVGTQVITVEDTTDPGLVGVPASVTVQCDNVPTPPVIGTDITGSDNCDMDVMVTMSQTQTAGSCPNDYTIIRTWTATDNCGNTNTSSQTITVDDTNEPMIITGAILDTLVQCDAPLPATTVAELEALGTIDFDIADNCSADADLTVSSTETTTFISCPRTVTRTYVVTDECTNVSANIVQMITIQDTIAPIITGVAQNLEYDCTVGTMSSSEVFDDWIENIGNASASDNCTSVDNIGGTLDAATGQIGNSQWFAFESGTWTVDQPGNTVTGTVANLATMTCSTLDTARIDFVIVDSCYNHAFTMGMFTVLDTIPPVFDDCLADVTLNTDDGDGAYDCEATYTFNAPIVTDGCNMMSTTCSPTTLDPATPNYNAIAGAVILSGAVDPNVIVDKVQLWFSVPPPPTVAVGNVSLELAFTDLDGEFDVTGSTEFFFIMGEDGTTNLGQTNPAPSQCSDTTTTITISEALFNQWALDGRIEIELIPNNPGAGNEDQGINNICGGSSSVSGTLDYACNQLPAGFTLDYSLDGGTTTSAVTYPTITETFPSGMTTVTFIATDCSGNASTCSFDVLVEDNEDPSIDNCTLSSLPDPIPAPDCMPQEVQLPRPYGVDDNCAVDSFAMMLTSGTDFLSVGFTEHPNIDGYVMDTARMTFTGVVPPPISADATIEVFFKGDLDGLDFAGANAEETLTVIGEDGTPLLFDLPANTLTDCAADLALVGTVTVPYNTLITWLADGNIDITVAPIVGISDFNSDGNWDDDDGGINPCVTPDLITGIFFDGTAINVTDSDSTMLAVRLSVSNPIFSYCVTGATTIAETDFPTDGSDPTVTLNPGTNTIKYKVADAAGNIDSVSCVRTIQVGNPTLATPNIIGPINLCPGDLITLEDNSGYVGTNATWTWYQDVAPLGNNNGGEDILLVTTTDAEYTFLALEGSNDYYVIIEDNLCTSPPSLPFNVTTKDRPLKPEIFASPNPVCSGDDFGLFIANSSIEWDSYFWEGSDGYQFTGNGELPPVITSAVNTSTINDTLTYILTVTSTNGCVSKDTVLVEVLPVPEVPVLLTNSPICNEGTIELSTVATCDNYQWVGPAGFVLTTTNAASIVSTDAEYTAGMWTIVCQDATTGCSTASVPMEVIINDPLNVVASNNSPICIGENAQLMVTTVNNATYNWSAPDAGAGAYTSLEQNPVVTAAGTYTVTVTDGNGCIGTSSTTVVVNDIPVIMSIAQSPVTGTCVNGLTDLTLTPTLDIAAGPYTYLWTGENGFASTSDVATIPNVTTANNGAYTLVTTNAAGCISEPLTVTVDVKDNPATPIIETDNVEVCEGESLVLTTQNYPGPFITYIWYKNGTGNANIIGSSSSPIYTIDPTTIADSGTYYVEVAEDGCRSNPSLGITITVSGPPIKPIISATPNPVCSGEEFTLAIDNDDATWDTYTWTGTNGYTHDGEFPPAVTSPDNTGTTSQMLTYVLTVANTIGCVNTDTLMVEVLPLPAQPSLTSNTPICNQGEIVLTTTATCTSYDWIGPDGLSAATTATPSATIPMASAGYAAGLWTVVCIDANACERASAPTLVTINNPITVPPSNDGPSCEGEDVQLSVEGVENAVSYQWSGPNSFMSNNQNPILISPTIAEGGTYTVTVMDSNGCIGVGSTDVGVGSLPTINDIVVNFAANACVSGVENITLTPAVDGGAATGAPYAYSWTGPNNFASTSEVAMIPNASSTNNGSYILVVTNAAGCMSNAVTVVVDVMDGPTAPTITNNGPICINAPNAALVLSILPETAVSGAMYEWFTAAGTSIGSTGLVTNIEITDFVTYPVGTHDFYVVATVNGCPSVPSVPTTAILNTTATVPVISASPNPVCSGDDFGLFIDNSDPNWVNYTWTGSNGYTYDGQFPPAIEGVNNTTAVNQLLTYELTVEDVGGCTATTSLTVEVLPEILIPDFETNSPICFSNGIILSSNAVCDNYEWMGPEGNITSVGSDTTVFQNNPVYGAGMWSLICHNDNGCSAEAVAQLVEIGESVLVDLPSSFSVCIGDDLQLSSDASANAVAFDWNGPSGFDSILEDPIITNITAAQEGTYTLKAFDEFGCPSGTRFTTVTVNPLPLINDIVVDPIENTCVGGDTDITLTPTINGGIDLANFTYSWTSANGFTSTDAIAVLPNGTSADNGSYVLTVSDVNGCESEAHTVVVDVRDGPVTPNLIVTASVLCTGEDLTISTAGYTGTFVEYNWYIDGDLLATTAFPSYTIENADNTDSGSYSVIVTVDDCDSNESQVIPITVDEMLPQPIVTAPNAICAGEALQLETDFIVGAEYAWTGPNGFTASVYNPVIFPVTLSDAGSYAVQVMVSGCMSALSDSHIVEVDASPNPPTVSNNGPLCYQEVGSTLVLSVETDSATPGATYTWYNATTSMLVGSAGFSTNFTVPNLSSYAVGMHEFYAIASVNGCNSNPSIPTTVVLNASPLKPQMASSTTQVCAGDEFSLGLANSSSDWTSFAWTGSDGFTYNEQFPPSITAENIGTTNLETTYILTVENAGGCINMDTIMVTVLPVPGTPDISSNSPVCASKSIILETNQVCNMYQWIGPNGNSTAILDSYNSTTTAATTTIPFNAEGYAEGIWTVICISANGCSTESAGLEVIINDPITVPPTNDGPSCEGEDIQLSVGVDNATNYQWVGPGGFSANTQNPTINNPTTANAGTYIVIVTDANGCTGLGTTIVEVSNKPVLTDIVLSHNSNECVTGNEDITMTPIVDDGDGLAGDTGAPYTFSWTGENGFVSTDSIAVLPNGTSADNGSYVLIVTNADGCETNAMTVVVDVRDEPSSPTLMVSATDLCVGDELVLTTQGYVGDIVGYQWSNGSTILGFTQVPSFTIPSVDVDNTGSYTVVVAVNGCTSNASQIIPVTVNATPTTPTVTGPAVICMGSTLQLATQFIDGAEYTWTGPDGFTASVYNPSVTDITIDNAGDYTVQVSMGDCSSAFSAPLTVMVTNAPVAPTVTNNSPICIDDAAAVLSLEVTSGTATAGASYEWFDATTNNSLGMSGLSTNFSLTDFTNYSEGVYEFYVVASVNGCTSSTSVPTIVVMNSIPALTANAGDDIVVCDGLSIDLNATAPTMGTGTWTQMTGIAVEIANPNAPNTAITGLVAGETYTFQWTLSNGACGDYDADEVNVVVSEANQIAEAGDIVAACNAGGVNLEANAANTGNTGTWTQAPTQAQLGVVIVDANDPNTAVTGLVSGNAYQFTWILSNAACGNFSMDIVEVVVEDNMLNAYAGEDFTACGDGDAAVFAEPVASCTGTWSSPNAELVFADNIAAGTVVMDLQPGDNILIWTVDCGPCGVSTDEIVITYETSAMAITDVLNVPFRESAEINVLTNDILPSNYTVSIIDEPNYGTLSTLGDGNFGYTHTNTNATPDQFTYQVCSTNCPDICSEVTTVNLIIEVDENCAIPTIITPNNDGINDAFIIECLFAAGKYPDNIVTIYNQWGDEIFRATEYANNWAGTYNGEDLPVGTYYYYVELGDGSEPLTGFLLIER